MRRTNAKALFALVLAGGWPYPGGYSPFPLRPESRLDCYVEARKTTLLTDEQALGLCAGSLDTGPVQCFNEATSTLVLDPASKLKLCAGASSAEPAECFLRGRETTMLRPEELVRQCSAVGQPVPERPKA